MRKLSQRELLEDGFASMLGGLARTARNAAGAVATAVAPETMGALKKGAGLAAGAIENIRSGSPTASTGVFLDSEDGKREFKNIKLGKETKLPNQNFKIEVKSGSYLNSTGGDKIEEKDLTGGYLILRRKNRGGGAGFDNEITEVWDSNNKRLNDKPIKAGTEKAASAVSSNANAEVKAGTTGNEKQNTLNKLEELGVGYPIKIGNIDYHYLNHNTRSLTTTDESGREKIHPIEGLNFEVYPDYNKAVKERDTPNTVNRKPSTIKSTNTVNRKPDSFKSTTTVKPSPNPKQSRPASPSTAENRFDLNKDDVKSVAKAKPEVVKQAAAKPEVVKKAAANPEAVQQARDLVQQRKDRLAKQAEVKTAPAAAASGARGKKGPRGAKSDSPGAARKRIQRALDSNRPASRGDVEILKKAGVKGSQTIGGVKLSNLTRRKLAEKNKSQKNILRLLNAVRYR